MYDLYTHYYQEVACNSSTWADADAARCGCRGRGWWLSEVDTWHCCPCHGKGVPHPEYPTDEEQAEMAVAPSIEECPARLRGVTRAVPREMKMPSPSDGCCGRCEALAWRPTLEGVVYYCGLNKEALVVEDGGDDEVRPSFARCAACLTGGWKERDDVEG